MYGAVNWSECTISMSKQSLKISALYLFAFLRYSQKGKKAKKLKKGPPGPLGRTETATELKFSPNVRTFVLHNA